MKIKLKIIKENKALINEGRYDGLYQVMGVYPGSLDIFLKHFVETSSGLHEVIWSSCRGSESTRTRHLFAK